MSRQIAKLDELAPLRRSGDVVFKKAAQIILAREQGDLNAVDRKIYNYLYSRALGEIRPGEAIIHRIPVADVLEWLGHSSTDRLNESLRRLSSVNIVVDYVDEDDVEHSAVTHYLSHDMAKTVDGWILYAFDPIVLRMMVEPRIFAMLSRDNAVPRWLSPYSSKLYEVMAMHVHRQDPTWTISIDTFREYMCVQDDYTRFDNLKSRVITAAVDEVNEVAPFTVEEEYIRTGRGGKVTAMRFTARPKGPKTLLQMRDVADPLGRGRRQKRDPNTLDLLDGHTDSERPLGSLSQEVVSRAIGMIGPDESLDTYVDQWRTSMRSRRVRDPDRSFLNWLDLKLAKQREADDALGVLDDDTFSTLVEQWEGGR